MVRKSFGKMRGTRKKLKVRRRPTVNDYMKEFKKGDVVSISIYPGIRFPHPNFQGRTGKVTEIRGRSYGVMIRDGGMKKTVFLKPVHLKGLKKDELKIAKEHSLMGD